MITEHAACTYVTVCYDFPQIIIVMRRDVIVVVVDQIAVELRVVNKHEDILKVSKRQAATKREHIFRSTSTIVTHFAAEEAAERHVGVELCVRVSSHNARQYLTFDEVRTCYVGHVPNTSIKGKT